MRKRDILLIAHFCDYGHENSNNRFNYIAQLLYENGYGVELVTSSFSHRDKKQRKEQDRSEYKTTLIYEPSYSKNISLKRFFYSHYVMAQNLKKYLRNRKKPDLIYCAIPSLDVAYVAKQYAEKHGIPFVIDVQDLWPEAFQLVFNVPVLSAVVFEPIKRKADAIYRAADEIVAVSQTYAERAMSNNQKCGSASVVYLGTDLQNFDNAVCDTFIEKSEDEVWLAYCGTLGHSYDLRRMFEAISLLEDACKRKLKFIVMGDGPLCQEYESYVEKYRIPVVFTGRLKYGSMCGLLKKCDVCINPISIGAAQSIINKHADYAASGLPVISTQENEEYKRMVMRYGMGYNCVNYSPKKLADLLHHVITNPKERIEMGRNARRCAEELFNRKHTYERVVQIIRERLNG